MRLNNVQAAKDLKDFDLARHDDFKKHAMDKEMRREDRLKKLSQLDRMKEEDKYIKQQEEIISHIPKINPVNFPLYSLPLFYVYSRSSYFLYAFYTDS